MKNPSRLKLLSSTLALALFRGAGIRLSAHKTGFRPSRLLPPAGLPLPLQTAGITWLLARSQTSTDLAIFSGDRLPLYNPHRKR